MVINVLDHVPQCYTGQDGAVIGSLIRDGFARGDDVTVSFLGVDNAPSSFVNAAFVDLLDSYSFDYIRRHLLVINSSPQINDLIRRRFSFATSPLAAE